MSLLDQAKLEVEKENMSYVENMISKIETGTKVLLRDSEKEGFAREAQLASSEMKKIKLGGRERTLTERDYVDFFEKMRTEFTDIDRYRKDLKTNSELKVKEAVGKLEREENKYMNKINFKLWPWVIVSFILGLGVIFLVMFVMWYFSNGDSQNSNTSNLYNDVFCGGCKNDAAENV